MTNFSPRNYLLILFYFIAYSDLFSTSQIPDLVIYKGDTLTLFNNPLESFYNEDNPRPEHFYVSGCGTACWRNYQAVWEIANDKLYLNSIQDCCLHDPYIISDNTITNLLIKKVPEYIISELKIIKDERFSKRDFQSFLKTKFGRKDFNKYGNIILENITKTEIRKAPLNLLFNGLCIDGRVHAYWYTGDLRIPSGKMLSYVHMGYMSQYEHELIINVEKGILIDSIEYDNRNIELKEGFGILQALSYSLVVPVEKKSKKNAYRYMITDTLYYSINSGKLTLFAFSKLNNERKGTQKRIQLVEQSIDSLSSIYSNQYSFSNKNTQKLRWGNACWIDGMNLNTNERMRIFSMSNINSQVFIIYTEKEINNEEFLIKADYIINSVKLIEFFY